MLYAITALVSYLIGSIPFGVLVGQFAGIDVRRHGSGNIGATNVLRILGKKYGIAVFLADALKQLSEPSRKEPGNLRFEVLVQNSRPNHLSVVEIWKDQAALEAHESAKHTVQFRMDTLPMSGSLYDQRLYQMIEVR